MESGEAYLAPYLFLILAFIVPGIIIKLVYSMFTTRRSDVSEKNFSYFISVGAVNLALWSWLIYPLLTKEGFPGHVIVSGFFWVVVLLVGPAMIGLLLGLNFQKEWTRRLLQFLGLRPVHALPTAWDGLFQKMTKPHWVLVRLKDGGEVAGYFGENSWAASDPTERDIYIEEIYEIQMDDSWKRPEEGRGVLLRPEEILSIEVWSVEGS